MQKKRKHVTLTIQEKLDIINCVEEGSCSRQAIASRFGIGKSTVHDIHKRRDKIRAFAALHNSEDVNKRRRVDQKTLFRCQTDPIGEEELYVKEESEAMMDSIEDFDYQEMNEQDYEVVYEANLPGVNNEKPTTLPPPKEELSVKSKRKSKTLTFREKYEVIMHIENGASVPNVCEMYGVGRTTVYDYMRRKREIIEFIEKSNDVDRRTFKKSKYPEVERTVIEWCDERDSYTKQEFYEFAKLAFDSAREHGSGSPSGFCGSWSWAKRFFHRHPQLKEKLTMSSGLPIDPRELSLTNVEYLDENIAAVGIKVKQDQVQSSKNKEQLVKYLNFSQKLEVLDDIDSGKSVAIIAEKFHVSKTTIYEIFKRRNELRDTPLTDINFLRKVWKMPRYPQLELELLQWCLRQKRFPLSNVLIADKALCIFETLGLTGSFNPSSTWAKKFVQRHPELYAKQGLQVDERVLEADITREETFINEHDAMIVNDETGCMETLFEFSDPDSTPHYEEEYIVEELDPQHDEDLESSPPPPKTIDKQTNQKKMLKIIKKNDASDVTLIPEQIALKSLKILIKFSKQQGHDDMLSYLIDYQTQLHDSIS